MRLSDRPNPWKTASLVGLALVAGMWMADGPRAAGQQEADATRYEYSVLAIEANTLQAKLNELAGQGWELSALVVIEAKVDAGDGTPKVITEKYDLTVRRALRK